MNFIEVLLIAIGLAMDAFAVCVGIGTLPHMRAPRPLFRLSFHFGLFQFLMPLLGWFCGTYIANVIQSVDHWVAFGLLVFVGVRMVRSGLGKGEHVAAADPSRGRTLVMLSVATSIDAFAIGLSLAMLRVNVLGPSVVIGIVAAGLSLVGLLIGHRLGEIFGKWAEVVGGIVLVMIGLRVVITHVVPALGAL